MRKALRKMCLVLFVFDYRRKKKKNASATEEPPRVATAREPLQRSSIATVINTSPVESPSPSVEPKKEKAESAAEKNAPVQSEKLDDKSQPGEQPEDVERESLNQIDTGACLVDQRDIDEEPDDMVPRPGSPLRPHLGHRWTSKHLSTFEHPFLPPSADQISIASTMSRDVVKVETGEEPTRSSEANDGALMADLESAASNTQGPSIQKCQSHVGEIDQAWTFIEHESAQPRRNRDDDVSILTEASTVSGFSITPTMGASSGPRHARHAIDEADEESISSSEFIDASEASRSIHSFEEITEMEVIDSQWTEEADRLLCVMWFFTAYSLNTIAEVLDYTIKKDAQAHDLDGNMVKSRLITLMQETPTPSALGTPNGYGHNHKSMYHGVLEASQDPNFDPAKRCAVIAKVLHKAWAALQDDLKQARRGALTTHWRYRDPKTGILQIHVGTDDLSDRTMMIAGLPKRRWSPEVREKLRLMPWTGLQKMGGCRPTKIDDVVALRPSDENAMAGFVSKTSSTPLSPTSWFARIAE